MGITLSTRWGDLKKTSSEPEEILDPIITRQNFQTGEKAILLQALETKIRPYNPVKSNGLSKVVFRPLKEIQQKLQKYVYDTS